WHRARDIKRGERSVRTRSILDDDGFLECHTERLGDDTANRIAGAAGAEYCNEGDRLAGIVVGEERRAEQCRRCGHENETQLFHAWFLSGYREFYSLRRRSRAAAPYQSVRWSIADPGNRCVPPASPKGPVSQPTSLGRHDAEVFGRGADPRALLRDIGGEVGRAAEIGDLPGEVQPFLDRRINGLPNICGDAFANSLRHGRRAEKADKAVERKV